MWVHVVNSLGICTYFISGVAVVARKGNDRDEMTARTGWATHPDGETELELKARAKQTIRVWTVCERGKGKQQKIRLCYRLRPFCIIEVSCCARKTHYLCFYDGYALRQIAKQVRQKADFSHTACYYTIFGNVCAERQQSLAWRIVFRSLFRRIPVSGETLCWHRPTLNLSDFDLTSWDKMLTLEWFIDKRLNPLQIKAHAKATRSWKSL